MGEKLTRADIDKIQAEIDERKLVIRPKLIAAVKEARAQGDLSENFEYYAAKREKNQNESRIGYLERMIRFGELIEDDADLDEAGLNKMVEVLFEDENETAVYKLVTPIRGQSLEGRVSIDSPIGKAMLGHRAGDRIYVQAAAGGYYIKIISVEPDDADADIRSF